MDRLENIYFTAKADEQKLLDILHKRRCKRRGIPVNTVRSKQYEQRAALAKYYPDLDKILSKISFPPSWERLLNTKPRERLFIVSPRQMLKDLAIYGDVFIELVTSPDGKLVATQSLEPETIFRIQNTKGELLEFQQSKSGPDYEALTNPLLPCESRHENKVFRFSPEKLLHFTISTERFGAKNPYGTGVCNDVPPYLPYDEVEKLVAAAAQEMSEKITECLSVNYNQQLVKGVINKCLEPDTNITEIKDSLRILLTNVETWGNPG